MLWSAQTFTQTPKDIPKGFVAKSKTLFLKKMPTKASVQDKRYKPFYFEADLHQL